MQKAIFPAKYENLIDIADFVMTAARLLPFDEKEIYNIQLAVDEASANVIDHAYRGREDGLISITVSSVEKVFVITMEDTGAQFDPANIPDPDLTSPLEIRNERGLGVYTMRKLMDEVRFEFPEAGHNRLVMTKRLLR